MSQKSPRMVASALLSNALLCCVLAWTLTAHAAPVIEVHSPTTPGWSVRFDAENFTYSVRALNHKNNTTIIAPSKLGLQFKDQAPFGDMELIDTQTREVNETWEYPWGRQREYHDHFNEATLTLREKNEPGRTLRVQFRVYNDGVALRYLIDKVTVGGKEEYVLAKELTQFNFNGDPMAWFTDFGKFASSQEKEYPKNHLSSIENGAHVGCPVVAAISDRGPYVALTEAELNHWGGLYFEGQPPSARTLFDSGVMKGGDEAKNFSCPLDGVHRLELLADDAGNGITSDHADWGNVFLTKKDGTKVDLTTIKPLSHSQDWGALRWNKSCDNNPLNIAGTEYQTGFGTHAMSKIIFDLKGEYKALSGSVGVDNEMADRGSVRFRIRAMPQIENVSLRSTLSPRRDGNGLAKTTVGPTPWRLIILAADAIDLVDQTILMNVSAPTDPDRDWSWIQPGTGSWDWWNNSNRDMSTESVKPFIDYASEMGWKYHILDDPWYAGKKYRMGDPRNNVLKGSDETDIEELVKYAREKNVQLFLWLNWKDIDRQMEEAFALYEKWGIAGVKIDFMDRDDQEMVEWYDKTVRLAAKHKLLIDFHGSYKPTGYRRAWPNLITREGIYGNEQNKWDCISPEHYCTLPFTRLMLGPGDFTPGAMLNRHFPDGQRVPGFNTAQGMGTRAHEWAICLLYDSPILCLCDRPELYRAEPEAMQFFRNLPTVWDESRGVEGEIGEYVSMVRRSGNDWYYAAITDNSARELTLKLDFLSEAGEYEATIYADNAETKTDARKMSIETKKVRATDTLLVKMSPGGGQAIVFKAL